MSSLESAEQSCFSLKNSELKAAEQVNTNSNNGGGGDRTMDQSTINDDNNESSSSSKILEYQTMVSDLMQGECVLPTRHTINLSCFFCIRALCVQVY